MLHISIDRGGTFTDVFARKSGESEESVFAHKLLSEDPAHYADAPAEGIRRAMCHFGLIAEPDFPPNARLPGKLIQSLRMGTTVATNALLERKGAPMALCVTRGFRDLLAIGDQSRPDIFDLSCARPELIFRETVEVSERVRILTERNRQEDNDYGEDDEDGGEEGEEGEAAAAAAVAAAGSVVVGVTGERVLIEEVLDLVELRAQLSAVLKAGIESLAVVLLHSYAYPEHERTIGRLARELGFSQVSLSSDLAPMVKVVPRGHTATVDAYLTPLITTYLAGFLSGFDSDLDRSVVQFMMSDGGLCDMERFHGFKAVLSGPAGGVVGYARTTRAMMQSQDGEERGAPQASEANTLAEQRPQSAVIGFDMGGTSTDVSRVGVDGRFEHVYDTLCAGVMIQAPQLDIHTVAAGGGSLLTYVGGLMRVGPESAGAHPGPVCYRKNGKLAVTDANVVLGRVIPEFFPKIFGENEDEPLDAAAARDAMQGICDRINEQSSVSLTVEECALGFIRVANAQMCRPIRSLTEAKGYAASTHVLATFGGAGGQHCCAIARELGMKTVFVHRYAGILSAYGIGVADIVRDSSSPCGGVALVDASGSAAAIGVVAGLQSRVEDLWDGMKDLEGDVGCEVFLNLRYDGTDTSIMVIHGEVGSTPSDLNTFDFAAAFRAQYKREYGFLLEKRAILVDDVRVRAVSRTSDAQIPKRTNDDEAATLKSALLLDSHMCSFEGSGPVQTPVYELEKLGQVSLDGPAVLIDPNCTILVEPQCTADVLRDGSVKITLHEHSQRVEEDLSKADPVQLAVFAHRFMAIAEQMGKTLQRTSISTNIKERLDFSCALFSPDGGLVANAPHLPVHLGAMQEAVRWQIANRPGWQEGEVLLSNSPVAGGSHLPDMTVITPVYGDSEDGSGRVPIFYVACRGHHADIGGISPGSMPPFSKSLADEGAIIESLVLVSPSPENPNAGVFNEDAVSRVLNEAGTRNLHDNLSDLRAQVASNNRGISLVGDLVAEYNLRFVHAYMHHVQANAELAVRELLCDVAAKHGTELAATDYMDDGSQIVLKVTLSDATSASKARACFDFTGTSVEIMGNINAPRAVTVSAVIYSLRAMVSRETPLNQGCLIPVEIIVPEGCFLNPGPTAGVVGGNVLTSQRVTDVVLEAFGAAANSQGCMGNLTFGDDSVGYYETLAGGAGAGPTWDGVSGTQVHMTNTRITDAETLERRYPVLLREFSLREGSGGAGLHPGGCGVVREIEFLADDFNVGILSERRALAPRGIAGGSDALRGKNLIIRRNGTPISIGGKNEVRVNAGDRVRILTPGGGGYGALSSEDGLSGGRH